MDTKSHIGYKTIITADNILCIATLEIPADSRTTENRKGIVDRSKAKYRCSKAKVISIKTLSGKSVEEAYSQYDRSFVYRVGSVITADFDPDIDTACGSGIHYFLSQTLYVNDFIKQKFSGSYTIYFSNGQKLVDLNLVNGQRHGPCTEYHKNGKVKERGTYVKDYKNGYFVSYYSTGIKELECDYVQGKKHGACTYYYTNGKVMATYIYEYGSEIIKN